VPLPPPDTPPMLARLSRELPVGDYVYEPKWDGFRCLAYVYGGVDLRSRHGRPLARYFPELTSALSALRDAPLAIDGELVLVRDGRFDFAALLGRLHPAPSRVERLAREAPAALVAFDLLAANGETLLAEPFSSRRARLERLLAGAPPPLAATPATRDIAVARAWLDRFHGGGIDGVVAKDASLRYEPGRRAMVKVKRERTADVVVAGLRLFAGEPVAVASLLLGLYEGNALRHVGVASSFGEARRRELVAELAPLAVPLAGHPWERGFGIDASPIGRLAGSAGRWDPGTMELDWTPLAPVRVCEVGYDRIDGGRFRHPARFVRWRPDRDPRSCDFGQLEAEPPAPEALLGL
jgi:ATP-dependent DNA ligase